MNSQDVSTVVGIQDALNFFDMIRERFPSKPYVYKYFVSIIKEYKHGRIGTSGLVRRVGILFKCHPDLIVEFNKFLPPNHRISITAKVEGEE